MRKWIEFNLDFPQLFVDQLVQWGCKRDHFVMLNSNRHKTTNQLYPQADLIAACNPVYKLVYTPTDIFSRFNDFVKAHNDWIFGFLSYDLKNDIENLHSDNIDKIRFPEIFFYVPEYVFIVIQNKLRIEFLDSFSEYHIKKLYYEITGIPAFRNQALQSPFGLKKRICKKEYLTIIEKIKQHIAKGDIYEMNFCQEFYAENSILNPEFLYLNLNKLSPGPFSAYLKFNDKFVLSSSPERFMAKRGGKIISQPIKGTAKRGKNEMEDSQIVKKLKESEKERAENIMIVDLVRNDLSKSAKKGSVQVEELCEIYSYELVHQMVSTITCEFDNENHHLTDIIKNAFPMGSMTGAPKIKAMELIELYEKTKRGIYSGSVGYIAPNRDFDFNVVIRSIVYNAADGYLSFLVGGAITHLSDPTKEYEECLLKAKAMMMVLQNQS
jgi:para-aminobenzoate synthetase component I